MERPGQVVERDAVRIVGNEFNRAVGKGSCLALESSHESVAVVCDDLVLHATADPMTSGYPSVQPDNIGWVTTWQMIEVDRIMVDELGIELLQMMENAGRHLAQVVIDRFAPRSVTVLAGAGGNRGGGPMRNRRGLLHRIRVRGCRGSLRAAQDPSGQAGENVIDHVGCRGFAAQIQCPNAVLGRRQRRVAESSSGVGDFAYSPSAGVVEHRDKKLEKVRTDQLLAARGKSKARRERTALADHLNTDDSTLAAFLDKVRWKTTGAESHWRQQSKPLMELAGLRSDDQAVDSGVSLVRSWVTDGRGPRSTDDVRAAVAQRDLLATTGTLVLAVHGNDREATALAPNVELDIVHLYDGDDSFTRKLFFDRGEWSRTVLPAINEAARALEGYKVRTVHVIGALRHPMWFAVGRSLPEVKKWTLAVDQVGATWRTDDEPENVEARVLADVDLGTGRGLAVALGLSGDPTQAVRHFLEGADIDVGGLVVFGPEGEPSRESVPSGGWAMTWGRSVREQARAAAQGVDQIHLFMQCPGGVALMLGHQWNVMPDTTVYEYVGDTYHPTVTLPGR